MTACTHLDAIHDVVPHTLAGCEDCLKIGSTWVHLRLCMTRGHVGCCDSSPHRHARQHSRHQHHPIVRSLEPGEIWGWCYIDNVTLEFAPTLVP
jgi:hypothetical protein